MGESSNCGQYQKLPPGWDCKFDQATGNCYYVNYLTKAMQLEDPRIRYKQLQNEHCSTESIPLQPLHASPYHVYPSNNLPAMRAFQSGPASHVHSNWQHHMSSSPLLSSRGHLEMSPLPFPKLSITQTQRFGNLSRRSTIQETSFSNHIDTDAVVTKIQNMFPTASENHIRLLLRRYYNREAVVISALQVEKHPVTMPGPFVTPPAQRHLFHSNSAFQMTPPSRRLDIGHSVGNSTIGGGSGASRTASPLPGGRFGSVNSMNSSGRGAEGTTIGGPHHVGTFVGHNGLPPVHNYMAAPAVLFHGSPRYGEQWRSSPKPHSSPKMKLRYMKTIFPKADEMLLLDILTSSDNNVQKASQTLISMGYTKRDYVAPKTSVRPGLGVEASIAHNEEQMRKTCAEKIIPLRQKEYSQTEKEAMQQRLKEKYSQIAERIIVMALESVNYSEDRAIQILQIVLDEENATQRKRVTTNVNEGLRPLPVTMECNEVNGFVGNDAEAVAADNDLHAATEGDNIITVVVEDTQLPIATDHSKDENGQENNTTNCTTTNHTTIDNQNDITNTTTKPPTCNISQTATRTISTLTTLASTSASAFASESYSSSLLLKGARVMKKRAFPCINVTTPTTATTQIILSNSPICPEHEAASRGLVPNDKTEIKLTTTTKNTKTCSDDQNSTSTQTLTTLMSLPSTSSPRSSFRKISVKSMLARFNNSVVKTGNVSSFADASQNAYGTASLLEKLKLSSRQRDKFDALKCMQRNFSEDEATQYRPQEFKSIIRRVTTNGQNNELSKGPDEALLLADYVTWNGANPDITVGTKQMASGSDPTLLSERSFIAHGRNLELCKGQKGLAKGSIYAQLKVASGNKTTNIKCN